METYIEARAKLNEAKMEFAEFEKGYKNKFHAHAGDKVRIKETGDEIVLDRPVILEDSGEWRFSHGFRITKSGKLAKKRTFIEREWHMVVNGIEYSCDWNKGF